MNSRFWVSNKHSKILSLVMIGLLAVIFTVNAAEYQILGRISVSGGGAQGNSNSQWPAVTSDGRYVAFLSIASNLLSGDEPNTWDVYVRDHQENTLVRLTDLDPADNSGSSTSGRGAVDISDDGRYVVFAMHAAELVENDNNNAQDIFLYDRDTDDDDILDEEGQTLLKRISVDENGIEGDADSYSPYISDDGRYVAYGSEASNLVASDTNNVSDIFVYDIANETVTRVSVDSAGGQSDGSSSGASISGDGRFVAFSSNATDLVTGDDNEVRDVFVHDRDTDENGTFDESGMIATLRMSVNGLDEEANNQSSGIDISADGDIVVFESQASNLVDSDTNGASDIFVRGVSFNGIMRVSVNSQAQQAAESSYAASISRDGKIVTFLSDDNNLTPNAGTFTVLYAHDINAVETTLVSVNAEGEANNLDMTFLAPLNGDGSAIVFGSVASNLVTGDTNDFSDVFLAGEPLPQLPSAFALTSAPDGSLLRDASAAYDFTWEEANSADEYTFWLLNISENVGRAPGGVILNETVMPEACVDDVCTFSVDLSTLENGVYSWTVIASNEVGEVDAQNGAFTFTLNTDPIELLNNGGFETQGANPKIAQGWAGKQLTGDQRRCGGKGDGSLCAFQFKGSKGEASSITQNVANARLNKLKIVPTDVLTLSARVNAKNLKTGAQVRVKIVYKGSPKVKLFNFNIPATTGDVYADLVTVAAPIEPTKAVKSLSVEVRYANVNATGTFYIDDVSLILEPVGGAPLLAGELVPMPSAPVDLRGN